MSPFLGPLINLGFGAEVIYSFVIIVCSLMIYFGTKELYELSSYKGIKYFRQAFLFFAIAYFFRSFIQFVIVYFNVREIFEIPPFLFGAITLLIFLYFSTLAIFYLLYSVMWKKWGKNSKIIYLLHISALLVALISIVSRNALVYLIINILLLIFAIIVFSSVQQEKNKHHGNLFITYILLFVFWILNIIDILIPNFFQSFQLVLYLISTGIFLTILYRAIKKTGPS